MSPAVEAEKVYKDIVAIFHASFHPTKGNVIDWSLKASSDLNLDGVEFCVLPSGLHLVERDVVYFTHSKHAGIALFRRRPTLSHGQRGFRLSCFGILLASSTRPRPWVHLSSLQALVDKIYASADSRVDEPVVGQSSSSSSADIAGQREGYGGQLTDLEWESAREWFEEHRVRRTKLSATEVPAGWSMELDGPDASPHTPTPHLPHLFRILGLSSMTVYKFVLSRRRILILTFPPVEVACILAWVSADLCQEHHVSPKSHAFGVPVDSLYGDTHSEETRVKECPRVLGMVTLSDLDRLERESKKGNGWIACTTDAIMLEKPSYYDLVIDLTTSTPSKTTRPTLFMTKPVPPSPNGKKRPAWKLETVRFTWSDLKLWTEVDRILKLDSSDNHLVPHRRAASLPAEVTSSRFRVSPSSSGLKWTEPFQLYEDVCLLCATLWMGAGTWRSNSRASFSTTATGSAGASQWGSVRLDGDDDWSLGGTHMRNLGMGIEGRPLEHDDGDGARMRNLGLGIEGRPSASESRDVVDTAPTAVRKLSTSSASTEPASRPAEAKDVTNEENEDDIFRKRNIRTTLALLQTFHAHTLFLLSQLREILPPPSVFSSPTVAAGKLPAHVPVPQQEMDVVVISSRDVLSMELGIFSDLDGKFIEWLAEAEGYSGPGTHRQVVVKRGWRDVLGVIFGFG